MKKTLIILIILSLFITLFDYKIINAESNTTYSSYELEFKDENLNLKNLKLKLAPFFEHTSYIKSIYFCENDKPYSFNYKDVNESIEYLKNYYINDYKENREILNNNIKIEKVIVYSNNKVIAKYKKKYPKISISRLDN